MEIMGAIINAISELLIENQTMKKLLQKEVPNLEQILRDAKADPVTKQQMENLLAPLRDAIIDDSAVEGLFQDIAKRPITGEEN